MLVQQYKVVVLTRRLTHDVGCRVPPGLVGAIWQLVLRSSLFPHMVKNADKPLRFRVVVFATPHFDAGLFVTRVFSGTLSRVWRIEGSSSPYAMLMVSDVDDADPPSHHLSTTMWTRLAMIVVSSSSKL